MERKLKKKITQIKKISKQVSIKTLSDKLNLSRATTKKLINGLPVSEKTLKKVNKHYRLKEPKSLKKYIETLSKQEINKKLKKQGKPKKPIEAKTVDIKFEKRKHGSFKKKFTKRVLQSLEYLFNLSTDKQLAKQIGISYQTYNKLKQGNKVKNEIYKKLYTFIDKGLPNEQKIKLFKLAQAKNFYKMKPLEIINYLNEPLSKKEKNEIIKLLKKINKQLKGAGAIDIQKLSWYDMYEFIY